MSHIYDDIVIHETWDLNSSDLGQAVWQLLENIKKTQIRLRPVMRKCSFPSESVLYPLQFCALGLAYLYALPSFLTILDKRYPRLRQLLDHIALKICEDYLPIVGEAVWSEIIFHEDDASLGAFATMMAILETDLSLEEKAWGFVFAYTDCITNWRESAFSRREFDELNEIVIGYVFRLRVFAPYRWVEFTTEANGKRNEMKMHE